MCNSGDWVTLIYYVERGEKGLERLEAPGWEQRFHMGFLYCVLLGICTYKLYIHMVICVNNMLCVIGSVI